MSRQAGSVAAMFCMIIYYYFRHRSSFQQNGFDGLLAEIDLDVSRISARNLGRDDR